MIELALSAIVVAYFTLAGHVLVRDFEQILTSTPSV
jgi:hypothetical protein